MMTMPEYLAIKALSAGVLKIMRNSTLLVLDNVVLSLSMSIVTLLMMILSVFPLGLLPYVLGFFALLAIFQCKAVALLIEKYEVKERGTVAGA